MGGHVPESRAVIRLPPDILNWSQYMSKFPDWGADKGLVDCADGTDFGLTIQMFGDVRDEDRPQDEPF
jgi:hypothetical protein